MAIVGRIVFGVVAWAARNGIADAETSGESPKQTARRTGIRGETYAYWYLRRQGYVMIARNFRRRGMKGEIDIVGFDGETVAFVEVKTRTSRGAFGPAEHAVTHEKRVQLARMARQFLREYRVSRYAFRFDVLAIESPPGRPPEVRLHKNAFAA